MSLLNYVPYMLSCPTWLVPHVPRSLRTLNDFLSHLSLAVRALVSHVPRALHTLVPQVSRALCGLIPHVPFVLVSHVLPFLLFLKC